jgi:DNA-binding NarL/FixJ family response regulator
VLVVLAVEDQVLVEEHAVADVAGDGEAVYVYGALKVGAYGFLLKDTPPDRLLAAIDTVHADDILFSASVIKGLVETCNLRPAAPEAPLMAAKPSGAGPSTL